MTSRYHHPFTVELYDDEENFIEELSEIRQKELDSIQGMFEHAEVVYIMTEHMRKDGLLFEDGYFTDSVMEIMGFKSVGKFVDERCDDQRNRYNKRFEKDNIVMYTDGTWMGNTIFINEVPFDCNCCYHPKDIAKLVGVSEWTFKNKSSILDEIETFKSKKEERAKIRKEIEEIKSKIMSKEDADKFKESAFDRFYDDFEIGGESFPVTVHNKEIGSNEDLEELGHFNQAMNSSNNFYFPTSSGEQRGNVLVDKKLNEVRANIIYQQLESNKEY